MAVRSLSVVRFLQSWRPQRSFSQIQATRSFWSSCKRGPPGSLRNVPHVRYLCETAAKTGKLRRILTSLGIFLVGTGATVGYLFYLNQVKNEMIEEEQIKKRKNADVGGPFTLVDHTGKTRTEKDFLGKWQLIYFGFTHCPDICPAEMEKMQEALNIIEKDKKNPEIKPIFITVDPARDDIQSVAEYLKDFHPNMIGLTGSEEQVEEACKAFRVYFSAAEPDEDNDYIVDHTTLKYLMNPKGKLENYYGLTATPKQMAKSIQKHIRTYNEEY